MQYQRLPTRLLPYNTKEAIHLWVLHTHTQVLCFRGSKNVYEYIYDKRCPSQRENNPDENLYAEIAKKLVTLLTL